MKTLILIILFFFLASVTQAVNTTCYVASDGAAGNTGLTPDSPKALPSQCLTVLAGAAPTTGHTLYIEKGSYTDNMTVSNANLAGVSIIGVDDLLTLAAANRSDVVISKTDDRVLYATRNCSISNLSMTGGTTALSLAKTDAAGITVTATNVHLYDARKYIVYVNAGSSWVSTGSKYEGGNDTDGWQCGILLNSNGPNSWTGSFDVYGPGALYSFGTNWGFANLGTGTLSLSNVDIAGTKGTRLIYQNNAGATTTIVNSIVGSAATYAADNNAGTMTIDHSIVYPIWTDGKTQYHGTVTETNPVTTLGPLYAKNGRAGYFILSFDDPYLETNNTMALLVNERIPLLQSRGVKATVYVPYFYITAADFANIRDNYSDLIEIGAHGQYHTDLTLTTAFTVQKAGQTITVDRAADTITVSGVAAYTPYKNKTLTQIRTWLTGTAGCTLGALTANLDTNETGEILAYTGEAKSINEAYTLALDVTADASQGLFKVNIADVKTLYDAWLSGSSQGELKSFAGPNTTSSETVAGLIASNGYTSMRSSMGAVTGRTSRFLSSVMPFFQELLTTETFIGTDHDNTTAQIQNATRVVGNMLANEGGIIALIMHGNSTTSGSSDITTAQLTTIIDTLQQEYPTVKITSIGDAIAEIAASSDYTSSGAGKELTYTHKAWTSIGDYRLRPGAPAIGAGVSPCTGSGTPLACCTGAGTDDGTCTDNRGRHVPRGGAWPIGATGYCPPTGTMNLLGVGF